MKIKKISPRTGKENTRDLDITQEQLDEINQDPRTRRNIQDIVPHLSATDREFLQTGYTQDDWDAIFQGED